MSCCEKPKQIFTGYVNLVKDKRFEFTNERIKTCQKCEFNTWLTKIQYSKWLVKNGLKILRNLDDLTALLMLPKQEHESGTGLYCRICKCYIPAKAREKENTCLKNKWRV